MATFRNYTLGDPVDFFTIFTDFTAYATTDWVITTTEAGAGSAAEILLSSEPGGVLQITNDAADNDADFFQWAGGTGAVVEPFLFQTGKALRFATRLKLSDATESDLIAGLVKTDTTPLDATDGIFFIKADGDNTIQLKVVKDSTATTVDVAEMVDATYIALEFVYDGNILTVFADGVKVASPALTNAPDDEQLALTFGAVNGEAAAKVLSVDYIGATGQR